MATRPANPSAETTPEKQESEQSSGYRFSPSLAAAVDRCWRKAEVPAEWKLTGEQFETVLERSVAHRFGNAHPQEKMIDTYLESLELRDLALAVACSAGNSAAWDYFVRQFRPELYRAARAIAGDTNARELADSLYADLYGLRESEGHRKSLFDYFHGRSKLGTWLRAVLAQRYVDEIRRTRKTEPLENESGVERREVAALASRSQEAAANPVPDSQRAEYVAILQQALTSALGALEPRDRLRLAYYYADDRTLAEIGRLLGEHEATVSRKLERTRSEVRRRVETSLQKEQKWTDAQLNLCLEYARGEWPFDLTDSLRTGSSPPKQVVQPDAASARD